MYVFDCFLVPSCIVSSCYSQFCIWDFTYLLHFIYNPQINSHCTFKTCVGQQKIYLLHTLPAEVTRTMVCFLVSSFICADQRMEIVGGSAVQCRTLQLSATCEPYFLFCKIKKKDELFLGYKIIICEGRVCVCVCTRLTPEQQRFELHESTYVQIFFQQEILQFNTICSWLNPLIESFRQRGTAYVESRLYIIRGFSTVCSTVSIPTPKFRVSRVFPLGAAASYLLILCS